MIYVDGVLVQTQSFANTTSVSFNSLGIMIPKGSQKEVTIKVMTYLGHPFSIVGAAGDVKYTVSMFDLDDINGNAIATSATLVGANLDVAPGIVVQCNTINPIQSTIIPASTTTSVPVANFEFRAQYGAAVMPELAIANLTPAGSLITNDATLVASYNPSALLPNFDNSSDGMILEVYNGTTMVGQGQLINGIAYVIFSTPVSLPTNTSSVLQIKARSNNPITNIGDRLLRLHVVAP